MELDSRLAALRARAREFGEAIRPYGLDLDRDPSLIYRRLDVPGLRELASVQVPPEFQPAPMAVGKYRFHLDTSVEKAVFFMEAARGDLGFMLALPGSSLSGPIVAALGDRRQQEWFFERMVAGPTWTFFGLTEPRGGSDAGGMTTSLTRDDNGGYRLDGVKKFVGNGVRAQIGVTFARRGRGPLAATAVLIDTTDPGFSAVPVPTMGLRGAALSEIHYDAVPIGPERLLGSHLPATRGGMYGWLRTFNLFRPVVAALGVGIAQAACDHVAEHRQRLDAARREKLARIVAEVESVRRLTVRAAAEADRDPSRGELGSAAKVRAAALAERATRYAAGCFGPGGLLEHPYLEKLVRDARAIEFMEGTGNVQRLGIASAVRRR
jgi:alkylation response protein AidB-like acyl-CoA dehydrogenase